MMDHIVGINILDISVTDDVTCLLAVIDWSRLVLFSTSE